MKRGIFGGFHGIFDGWMLSTKIFAIVGIIMLRSFDTFNVYSRAFDQQPQIWI